jgi:uncharacterized protein with PIN domain
MSTMTTTQPEPRPRRRGRKLVTLRDNDEKRLKHHERVRQPKPNGVACPECGEELVDTEPLEPLNSWPPKKRCHCQACGWQGRRVA